MTPGNGFGSVPPQRGAGPPRHEPAEVEYEYRTVRIKNYWSRLRQDREINAIAAQGWEFVQRSPRGGLFGGGSDTATFRRRIRPGQQRPAAGWARISTWWGRQGTLARWAWGSAAALLLAVAIVNEAAQR